VWNRNIKKIMLVDDRGSSTRAVEHLEKKNSYQVEAVAEEMQMDTARVVNVKRRF